MTYFSHSKETEHGKIKGSKLLKNHIQGVKEKALKQFYDGVNFNQDIEELRYLVKVITDFHDLGKYTSYFQDYLLQRGKIDFKLKQHSRFGGYAAYHFLKDEDEKKAFIALFIIFHHHLQLIDLDDIAHKINGNSQRIFEEQLKSVKSALKTISEDLEIEYKYFKNILYFPNKQTLRKQARVWVRREQDIADYFLINYLFSLLIEADKLDASETLLYNLKEIAQDWVDKRFGAPGLSGFQDLAGLSNNKLRNYCRAEVISHLQDDDILDQYLFTLTAPTGIGKTMTALDFALKLKSKLRSERDHEAQIIYALPFINIIEQAIDEYQVTFSDEDLRILGHYQFADVFGIQKGSDDESSAYHQKLMTLDTWQSDVVITSFVQFFETVISNRNKLLKKFNHLAGSIIILDEVQTLRLDQMPLIGATLYYLAKFMDARIIMMTATKPKIFRLAEEEILENEGESVYPKELLTSHEKVFSLFERSAIHPILNSLTNEEEKSVQFVEEVFDLRWEIGKSCLIVCNTVNRSIEIYDKIKKYLEERGTNNPIFYLSTNTIPADRMDRIKEIKKAIEQKKAPILIATQVVEAGVDLDFDMGFRDVGPIDSIIQVAGRINRNNNKTRQYSSLFIVDFEECQKVYGQITYRQSKKALKGHEVIPESDYLGIIERYFDDISERSSFRTSREYFKSMKSLKYDSDDKQNDYPVSAFRIIEESDLYRPVFIERDEEASFLREKYLEKIIGDISREDFDRNYKMDFQQHIISVPHYYTDTLLPINEYEENILVVSLTELAEFYHEESGFIRDQETDSIMIL